MSNIYLTKTPQRPSSGKTDDSCKFQTKFDIWFYINEAYVFTKNLYFNERWALRAAIFKTD